MTDLKSRPIYVKGEPDIPKGPHFAIIDFESMYIEGDERSRTNPGHGYPGHNVNYCNYIAFTDEELWKKEIDSRANPKYGTKKNFFAIRAVPAVISTQTVVSVA